MVWGYIYIYIYNCSNDSLDDDYITSYQKEFEFVNTNEDEWIDNIHTSCDFFFIRTKWHDSDS
jgi:hypothetical protein